jgi:cytochrome c oxidase cbb3-type subunit III
MEPNEHNIIEKDELTGDNLISGHEYDGIKELDNRLPKWWLGLFYITIIFAAVYFLRFHVLKTAPLQEDEYTNEVAAAQAKYKDMQPANTIDASSLLLLTDEASLASGKAIFDKNCVVCHLAQGQGLVGPNLTDNYWIHGCTIGEVFNLITIGVPEKGMISWKTQLTPEQIQQVASYVLSLKGTNPPNPKEPQGQLCGS